MNIQELQTIVNYGLKLKTIIINNHVYGITKAFQKKNFGGRMEACGPKGYNPPDFKKIVSAYGIRVIDLNQSYKLEDLDRILQDFLEYDGPVVLDFDCHDFMKYEPCIFGWDTPIEDMYPYLPRQEFLENMIIEPLPNYKNPAMPDVI